MSSGYSKESHARTLSDPSEVERVSSLAAALLDGSAHLNLDWIRRHEWVAVPIECGGQIDPAVAERLSSFLQTVGRLRLFAVTTEFELPGPHYYEVPARARELFAFGMIHPQAHMILFPEDGSFAYLSTANDYHVAAGSPRFVEHVLGTDIASARAEFEDFVSTGSLERFRRFLQEVSKRYSATGA